MRICITGGAGSIGSAVANKLAGNEIVILDNHEHGVHVQMGYHPEWKFILGDVCDRDTCERAFHRCDVVFHTAARKYVPICEANPYEADRVNIHGTATAILAASLCDVKKFLFMSTDKAVKPYSAMGKSKLAAEKLLLDYSTSIDMKMSIVRSGNVIGSEGCFFDSVERIMRKNKEVPITNYKATRYILTKDELSDFIVSVIEQMETRCVYIPPLRKVNVFDYLRERYGSFTSREVGLRPGEKLHEELLHEWEKSEKSGNAQIVRY